MARSKSFFDDIKKELECSVCQEQFSEANEPKILKCLHTFCTNCLEAWLRKQRNGELSCPSCRHITHCDNNDINRLPSNLFCKQLVEIVEAYGGQGQEDSPQCGNCDEQRHLKFYCSNCNFFLCGDCAGLHKKFKSFRGHEIKEIGNFESDDLQDYSRKTNICKHHQDENRFFCVNCEICICRDCVVLEHHDHKKISLQQGIENNESEIEDKMRKVRANRSWLMTFRETWEGRRLKQGNDIEEATKEVKRVAQNSVLLIRQHEASVTEKLFRHNEALQGAFSAQINILDGKVMEIDNTLAFCEEVLQRKNLPEILNVKTMIEERLQELSLTMDLEKLPKLDSSRVKYVPSDFEFPTYAPGKLLISNAEPLKCVAEGKGLTEGRVGDVCTFTIITKDSSGKTTYSEIDEVKVAIKSKSQQEMETLEPKNTQDGRYSVSYRPRTHGEYAVTININGIAMNGSPFILEVMEKLEYRGVKSVIRKEHKLEGNKLTVMAYYPFLHNMTKKKTDIQLDPNVLNFIQRNHDRELQEVSKELKIQIEHPNNPESPVIISISPADNRKDSNQSWDERVEDLKNFLENFQKSHLDIPSEIFDEIVKRWKADGSSDGSSDFLISFDKHRRLVQVTGKRLCVAAEMHKIEELTLAVKEDRELMKTVVEVVEDNIPESRLKLLEMSGICEKLRNDHQHLTISVDSTGQKLFLKGPRCLLQEIKIEIFKFISKIVDKTTELPGKVVDVLRKPQVSRFMLDLLKEKAIGAVLLYDQSQVSNEVTVVGVDSINAKKAEKILLDTVRERSLPLTPENAAIFQSSRWRNFKHSLAPNCMVQVSEDIFCSTVWICGIARYVDECFDKVSGFLERNTVRYQNLSLRSMKSQPGGDKDEARGLSHRHENHPEQRSHRGLWY
ncbi:uncharacterized protein [Montipora foliosa]|uniref:uncharacterized protein n=1 Tax=Montipora foliosa TaxID=591990 RepID=UPI0035F20859